MNLIRCPLCGTLYRKKDLVVLDIVNTITHSRCVDRENCFPIKDSGTYGQILKAYPFFMETRNTEED